MSAKQNWMIYGANGYTGQLVAEEARRQGLTPILAGRNQAALQVLGSRLDLEYRVFDLSDIAATRAALEDVKVVAHLAGPFSATGAPMIDACLVTGTHYLDIAGEIDMLLAAHDRDGEAHKAGVVICQGAGFDIIPTDCLAACLKQELPGATHLMLGFDTDGGLSPGTAKAMIEGLSQGGRIRENGELRRVPMAYQRRDIDFGRGVKHAMTIPWADVATAWFSTGIPNTAVYIPVPKFAAVIARRLIDPLRQLLNGKQFQHWLKEQVESRIKGPDETARKSLRSWVWGEARDGGGKVVRARIETGNGYDVTVHGVLLTVRHLLDYSGEGGYFTPSMLLGPRCIEALPGSGSIVIS